MQADIWRTKITDGCNSTYKSSEVEIATGHRSREQSDLGELE